jgi:polygalacturonase
LSIACVSVKSYGAAGDGSTDDTAAIQNANNAAASQGVALYFPAGTYVTSKTLVQTTTWFGQDAGTVYDTNNLAQIMKNNGNTNGSSVVQVNASNVSCRYLSCIVPNPPTYE